MAVLTMLYRNEGNLGDNIMRVLPDKNRVVWLLMLLAVIAAIGIYRAGFHIPVPGFNEEAVRSLQNSAP